MRKHHRFIQLHFYHLRLVFVFLYTEGLPHSLKGLAHSDFAKILFFCMIFFIVLCAIIM